MESAHEKFIWAFPAVDNRRNQLVSPTPVSPMGQQQLLLLVLGIVIVGIATVAGIQIFDEGEKKYADDRERQAMLDFASAAQVWKMKPAIFGGGAAASTADFSAFVPSDLGLTVTANPGSTPVVEIENVGCFRFFPAATGLTVHALNDDCELGSWDKGIIISGITHTDITWAFATS